MQKLYQKHELWFALGWIAFYVVAVSFADELSRTIGIEKIVTLPLLLAMCAVLLLWTKRNDLFQTFGLCTVSVPPTRSTAAWVVLRSALARFTPSVAAAAVMAALFTFASAMGPPRVRTSTSPSMVDSPMEVSKSVPA